MTLTEMMLEAFRQGYAFRIDGNPEGPPEGGLFEVKLTYRLNGDLLTSVYKANPTLIGLGKMSPEEAIAWTFQEALDQAEDARRNGPPVKPLS